MYVKNAWYVASWASEVSRELKAITILERPVVLYRTSAGEAVAMEDRCCHRRVPLSLGSVVGDNVQCGYHGYTFAPSGACVEIPNQKQIPPSAKVQTFPVHEKHHLIWIWMGDPSLADKGLIPNFSALDDSSHAWKGDYLHASANYRLITDNLSDLSHLTFVHKSTIGNQATALATIDVESSERSVVQTRWMIDTPPPPTYQKLLGLEENIDRWQIVSFLPPSNIQIRTGGREPSTGIKQITEADKICMYAFHAITPETATTSHYFWAQTHNYRINEPDVTEALFNEIKKAFNEDLRIFAAQQAAILKDENLEEVSCRADGPQIQTRRLVDRLLEAERSTTSKKELVSITDL